MPVVNKRDNPCRDEAYILMSGENNKNKEANGMSGKKKINRKTGGDQKGSWVQKYINIFFYVNNNIEVT